MPYSRYTKFTSYLHSTRDFKIRTEDDLEVTLEFNLHGDNRSQEREVLHSTVLYMVQRQLESILDLTDGSRFIITDSELGISIVGGVAAVGLDLVVSIISAVDSPDIYNPHETVVFAM